MIPTWGQQRGGATLSLDFINNDNVLDSRITFSRGSTASYYNSVGTLVSAAINAPRFDYNPSSFAFQNLLTQSQTFTTAAGWLITSLGFTTPDYALAPDNSVTATLFDEGTDNSAHAARSPSPVPAVPVGYTYTASCYFKYVSRQWVVLAISAATTSYASAKFDILNGVLGSTANSGSTFPSAGLSSSITAVGNGWYRCSITFNTTTTGTINLRVGMATDGTTFTAAERGLQVYTGTNQQVLVWGSQLSNTSTNLAYYATTTAPFTQCVPRGLLIEESRANSLTYSEDLTNAAWVLGTNTVTSNAIAAPDGNVTADLLIPTSATVTHIFYQTASVTSGSTYIQSVYAKAGGYAFLNFGGGTGFNSAQYINFDVQSGTVSTSSGFTGTITPVGNGWYRCTVTAVATSTTAAGYIIFRASSAARTTPAITYAGNGTSGVYVWGVQLELGAFATSYIPTTTAAATRSADLATMTGANLSSWYNQSQGTFVTQIVWEGLRSVASQRIYGLDDGSAVNVSNQSATSANALISTITAASSTEVNTQSPAVTFVANTVYKISMAYATNNTVAAANGTIGTTDTVCVMPSTLSNFRFAGTTTTAVSNIWFASLNYYPTRLADSTLQALTT